MSSERRGGAPGDDRRDAILGAVSTAAELLLGPGRWDDRVADALATLGRATGVDRVYVFESTADADGGLLASQRWEWAADGVEPQIDNPELQDVPFREAGFERWMDLLERGEAVRGDIEDFPPDEQALLRPQGIASLVAVPVRVDDALWGFMGFDATGSPRGWTTPEVDALGIAANVLGAGMGQRRALLELRASRRSLLAAYHDEQRLTARLRELDRMKDTFIEALSHELRTPLTAVNGTIATLRRWAGEIDAETRATMLERAAVNGARLERLLTDLLDVGRLRQDTVDVLPERVDVETAILDAVEACDALPPRRVDVAVSPSVATCELDGVLFGRVLANLLGNTARHTPATTSVWIRADGTRTRLHLIVADDGPGVPPELREHIFLPFERVPGRRPHAPGAGVGLHLVASFATLHGGRAWVEQRDGGGAEFHVVLAEPRGVPSSLLRSAG